MRCDGFADESKEHKNIEVSCEASAYTKHILDVHKDLKGIFDIIYKTEAVADALIRNEEQDAVRVIRRRNDA